MKKIDIDDALRPEAMDAEIWQQLTAVSECYACSIGERLHEEGTRDNRLIIVLSGLISLNREIEGKDQRSGLIRRAGEVLASASLHLDAPKVYSNVVDSDRAIVLIVQKADVYALYVAGTSRATVSKTLAILEGEGIISRKYGEIVVLEPDRLKHWTTELTT